jgi:hypothetical protein
MISRLRLFLSIFLFCIVIMACATDAGVGSPTPPNTGIEGQVSAGPVCPAVQQDQTCPDEPFAAEIVVKDSRRGNDLLTVSSGEDGRFRINLAPGEYTLLPVSPNPGAPPFAESQLVKVEVGRYTQVTIKYDTGIR